MCPSAPSFIFQQEAFMVLISNSLKHKVPCYPDKTTLCMNKQNLQMLIQILGVTLNNLATRLNGEILHTIIYAASESDVFHFIFLLLGDIKLTYRKSAKLRSNVSKRHPSNKWI